MSPDINYVITPGERPSVAVGGPEGDSGERFPVHRIYCIGRNYADHTREMGGDPDRNPPVFFAKPADAVVDASVENGAAIPYPQATDDLHHEIELVVALGESGQNINEADALAHVYGYAVGIDLTRRDLQGAAKKAGTPWTTGKYFDNSAPISAISPAADIGHPSEGRIWLSVSDEVRQDGNLDQMIWSVAEIIAELSRFYALRPGDLIFTGTPAGVGAIEPGDTLSGGVEGVGELSVKVG